MFELDLFTQTSQQIVYLIAFNLSQLNVAPPPLDFVKSDRKCSTGLQSGAQLIQQDKDAEHSASSTAGWVSMVQTQTRLRIWDLKIASHRCSFKEKKRKMEDIFDVQCLQRPSRKRHAAEGGASKSKLKNTNRFSLHKYAPNCVDLIEIQMKYTYVCVVNMVKHGKVVTSLQDTECHHNQAERYIWDVW